MSFHWVQSLEASPEGPGVISNSNSLDPSTGGKLEEEGLGATVFSVALRFNEAAVQLLR